MSISTDKSLTPEALVSVGLVLFPTHPQGPSREADGQAPVEGGGAQIKHRDLGTGSVPTRGL